MNHNKHNAGNGRGGRPPFPHAGNAPEPAAPNDPIVPLSANVRRDRSPNLSGLSGCGGLEVIDAMHGEVQVVCTLSGSSIIAKPDHIIAALERFKAAQTKPLAVIGNGEYANHIGEN